MVVSRPATAELALEAFPAAEGLGSRILKEAAACTTAGAVGALLRREGLYSSHLVSTPYGPSGAPRSEPPDEGPLEGARGCPSAEEEPARRLTRPARCLAKPIESVEGVLRSLWVKLDARARRPDRTPGAP